MKRKTDNLLILLLWTVAVASSMAWNLYSIRDHNQRLIQNIGQAFFREIETTRLWNAGHGGVYVPITEETRPNPYLKDEERDIITVDGMRLTKINPAFMTRQIAEIAKTESDIQYHITSLNPIRPANRADEWESLALGSFEAGSSEAMAFFKSEMEYRYMAPLEVKPACLKCHAEQGYQLGEIRGGISVTIPAREYYEAAHLSGIRVIGVHLGFWIIGLLAFHVFARFRDRQMALVNRKNMELEGSRDQLRKAKEAAETAADTKAAFLANMSHEIRTPMNGVLGFMALALEAPHLPEPIRENLEIAHRSANHLLFLLNDILDVSKLESGKMELAEQPFDLRGLVEETLRIIEIKAREKGLKVEMAIDPGLPLFYRGDAFRLRQVLINLMGNAVKFTEKGSVAVNVSPAEEIRGLCFEVRDTGIGIPQDRLERIFDPFTQADISTARCFGGTGLGTTICRELVQLMGGEIGVRSRVREGSIFSFTVPMAATHDIPHNAPGDGAHIPARPHRCFRVLIAEDIEENILLARIRLEKQGHEVYIARNGEAAVKIFRKRSIDIILMDIHMPVMNGFEAARRIRETEQDRLSGEAPRVPIIALTASILEYEKESCYRAGMDAVVGKPIDFAILFSVMERLVPHGAKDRFAIEACGDDLDGGEELPAIPGVDMEKGILTWGNRDIYRQALIDFARNYADVPARISRFLASGDTEEAYLLSHSLKGISGNLSVSRVYDLAAKLDLAICKRQIDAALSWIAPLEDALNDVLSRIGRLESPESQNREAQDPEAQNREVQNREVQNKEDVPLQPIDPATLRDLFTGMNSAFDRFNPDELEPFIQKLKAYLPGDRIDLIRKEIQGFNFKNARAIANELAASLGIEPEE